MPSPAGPEVGHPLATDHIFLNFGWRIDPHVATADLADRARSAEVERAPSHGERWPDHIPVTVVHA